MGLTMWDCDEAPVSEQGKDCHWDHSLAVGKIKLSLKRNGKNSLHGSRKFLPETEFDRKVDPNCTVHGHVDIPYLHQYN